MFTRRMKTVAALLAASALVASGAALAAGVSDGEIVLGTHLDLSGPTAAATPQLRNGMQMRLDEANEAGGVNGRKLRLVVEDNALQPAQAVRAVQKLTRKDEVFAIVNPFGSGTNAAAVKGAVEAGTVYFAPWGASAIIQAQGGNSPLVFTTVTNYDSSTAASLAWAIKNWNASKIGVIYQGDALGELVRRGVKKALDAAGLQPVAEASYKPGDVDFSSQVTRMRQAGAEVVVMATVIRETIGVMAETKKIGWTDVKMLTGQPGRAQLVAALGKGAVEGLYGIGGWNIISADTATPAAKAWSDSYRKRFGIEPNEHAMLAWSYTDWFLKGVQGAGRGLTADSFVKAIGATSQEDFVTYQRATFKGNHVSPETVRIEQVRDGRWVAVSPTIVVGN